MSLLKIKFKVFFIEMTNLIKSYKINCLKLHFLWPPPGNSSITGPIPSTDFQLRETPGIYTESSMRSPNHGTD